MDNFEKTSLEFYVQNMWGSRGNNADALFKNLRRKSRHAKIIDFSKEPRKYPLHTLVQKSAQGFASRAFPRIHSAHHNKKSQIFLFQTFSCEDSCIH